MKSLNDLKRLHEISSCGLKGVDNISPTRLKQLFPINETYGVLDAMVADNLFMLLRDY